MIQFTKPQNLNGEELLDQLKIAGVDAKNPTLDDNDIFYLDLADKDMAKAKSIIEAHNGTMIGPEPTIDQKLASVGLSLNDLKAALGL
jgi:hypothetical protein